VSADAVQLESHLPLEERVTFRISRLHSRLNAQATRMLNRHGGLSLLQWRVMVMVDRSDRATASEIVRETQIDKGLVSRTVKGMVAAGVLAMRTDPSDHRAHILDLTEKGRARFEHAKPYMLARQAQLLDSLSDEERQALFATLDRLETALSELDETLDLA